MSENHNKDEGTVAEDGLEDILEFDGKANFNYKEFSKDYFNYKVEEIRETLGEFSLDKEVIVGD